MDDLALNYQSDFNTILQMIADARRKAAYQVNAILTQEPGIRGYSPQNIWRMKQFFETYCDKPELGTLKLISKEILQKKLEELTEMVDDGKNSQ